MFIGLQLGMMISTMDGTIVATALPSSCTTSGACLYGKIGDVYGRTRVLFVAIGLFVVGSALCGLAQSMPQLLVARALQGCGGGGLGVLGMAIMGDVIPPRQLGRWLGYQGAVFAGAAIAGPTGGCSTRSTTWARRC